MKRIKLSELIEEQKDPNRKHQLEVCHISQVLNGNIPVIVNPDELHEDNDDKLFCLFVSYAQAVKMMQSGHLYRDVFTLENGEDAIVLRNRYTVEWDDDVPMLDRILDYLRFITEMAGHRNGRYRPIKVPPGLFSEAMSVCECGQAESEHMFVKTAQDLFDGGYIDWDEGNEDPKTDPELLMEHEYTCYVYCEDTN